MAGVAQTTVYAMRREVEEKLDRLPLKFFDSRTHGEILSRAVNDMDNISSTLQQSLTQLITSVVTLIGVIVMMLTISWLLTLVVLVTLPLSILVTTDDRQALAAVLRAAAAALGELNGHVEEMYTGHTIVKAFGREEQSVDDVRRRCNDKLYEAGWRAQFVSGIIMPLMNFDRQPRLRARRGDRRHPGHAAVASPSATCRRSSSTARQFSQPITQLASIANIIQLTIASAERVFELLDEPEETPEAVDAQGDRRRRSGARRSSTHVNFGYKPRRAADRGHEHRRQARPD